MGIHIDKEKREKVMKVIIAVVGIVYIGLDIIVRVKKKKCVYADQYEEKKTNAKVMKSMQKTFYEKHLKRVIDKTLSFCGLVVLSPVYAVISLVIIIYDPGPVLFTQKRIGKNKEYFECHKFRTMKMSTPHDVPTHMLENPEKYITGVGRILRKYSLDELPQIWDIFIGNMSIIGPRPALWNQDDLVVERDKYGANNVVPGLTGWAQINGRDELEIPVKAELDGEYVEKLKKGNISGFFMDIKCFFGTIRSVLQHKGVVEGFTGEMYKESPGLFGDEKDITVSIVTYNSKDEIDILMKSLERCSYFKKLTVYVVDNASDDGTAQYIKEKYHWVRVIENTVNLGFGKGHNKVIKHVSSKYHIIVNPDIFISEDSIERSVEYLDFQPDIVVMTPCFYNVDGSLQYLPKKNPSMRYMVGGMFENKLEFCKKWREEYTLKDIDVTEPIDVEFCSGAFMFTRVEALQSVGGFDEQYFLHFEDADLTRKLRKIGRAVYNPNIGVTHKWHRENKKINKSFWIALNSMMKYMKKWRKDTGGGGQTTTRSSNYGKVEIIKNIRAVIKTRIFYPTARLIREYFVVRGKQYINFGNNLTVGYRCQFEVNGIHNRKCLIIGSNVNIGHEVRIQCANHIEIGDNVLIGSGVLLIDHSHGNYSGSSQDSPEIPPNSRTLSSTPIVIGDNVWLGENCVIQQGVTVGSGSIVAANTVVTKNVPENVIVGGAPARILKKYDNTEKLWRYIDL